MQLSDCKTFCQRSLQAFEKGIVSESLLSFALRLHGLVIGTEVYFMSSDLQESTHQITLSPRLHMTVNASIQCAFVQMVAALLSHKCGIDWLAKSGMHTVPYCTFMIII